MGNISSKPTFLTEMVPSFLADAEHFCGVDSHKMALDKDPSLLQALQAKADYYTKVILFFKDEMDAILTKPQMENFQYKWVRVQDMSYWEKISAWCEMWDEKFKNLIANQIDLTEAISASISTSTDINMPIEIEYATGNICTNTSNDVIFPAFLPMLFHRFLLTD